MKLPQLLLVPVFNFFHSLVLILHHINLQFLAHILCFHSFSTIQGVTGSITQNSHMCVTVCPLFGGMSLYNYCQTLEPAVQVETGSIENE